MGRATPPPAVAECLRALGGEAWTLEGVVAQRDNSRIHRARSGFRTAAIKECLDRTTLAPDSAAAQREYSALTRVAAMAAQSGGQPLVPLPLTLCADPAVYAMTWVPGRTATDLILTSATGLEPAAQLGVSAAVWLRRFHACRPMPSRQNDFASKVDFVDQLGRTASHREPVVRRAADILAERAAVASAVPMPASWIHGDFKSDNLLVEADRVTGLDVQLVDENTVAYDLAPFLNHLYLLRWSPRGFPRRRHLHRMGEEFLRAYSPDAEQWTLPLLWFRSYLLLQIVANAARSEKWRALVVKWPARSELGAAIDQLEKCR